MTAQGMNYILISVQKSAFDFVKKRRFDLQKQPLYPIVGLFLKVEPTPFDFAKLSIFELK